MEKTFMRAPNLVWRCRHRQSRRHADSGYRPVLWAVLTCCKCMGTSRQRLVHRLHEHERVRKGDQLPM